MELMIQMDHSLYRDEVKTLTYPNPLIREVRGFSSVEDDISIGLSEASSRMT